MDDYFEIAKTIDNHFPMDVLDFFGEWGISYLRKYEIMCW